MVGEANFSLDWVVDQWELLYCGLLSRKGARVE